MGRQGDDWQVKLQREQDATVQDTGGGTGCEQRRASTSAGVGVRSRRGVRLGRGIAWRVGRK